LLEILKAGTTRDIALVVSKVLHPNIFFAVAIVAVAHQVGPGAMVWGKWALLAVLPAVLLPQAYMQARAHYLLHRGHEKLSLHAYFREDPREMGMLALLFALPAALMLYFLGAPSLLMATMVGAGAAACLVAAVNWHYRASFHLGLFTSAAVALILVCGVPPAIMGLLIVLVAGSRYLLGAHTPLQMLAGFIIGLIATGGSFYGFGLLG